MSIIKAEEINRFVDRCVQQHNTSTQPHEINEHLVSVASNIVAHFAPSTTNEVLFYLCSLNLLNAAIKIKEFKNKLSYAFIKTNAAKLISVIDGINECSISYYYNKEEKCLYFKLGSIVFSFHQVPLTVDILKANLARSIQWPGIRLQQIAQPLFEHLIELLRDEPVIMPLLDSTIVVKASNNPTEMNGIINNKSVADLIKEIYPNLPTLPGWYVKLTDLLESLRNTTHFSSDNITYDGLKSIIRNIEWLTLKSDYIDKTTGEILEVIKIMGLTVPNPISNEDKAILAQKILSVIGQACSVDSDGWYDLVEIAPRLFSNGINYKEYGYSKLSVFLESIFGDSMQRRNHGTMVYLRFPFMEKAETSYLDNIGADETKSEACSGSAILRGFNVGDIVEIGTYGIVRKGRIVLLDAAFVEVSLEGERPLRIRYEAISSVEALKTMSAQIDEILSAASTRLKEILEQAKFSDAARIVTNATITMVENRRIWLTTEEGLTAACFKGNIIGYAKEKLVRGQRVYTFSPQNEKAYCVILEMSYQELLETFEKIAIRGNENSVEHRKSQILNILAYLTRHFESPETIVKIKALKKQIKQNIVPLVDGSDNNIDDEDDVIAQTEVEPVNKSDSLPSDEERASIINPEADEKQPSETINDDSAIFRPETSYIQGPKVFGKIDLSKIWSKKSQKDSSGIDSSMPAVNDSIIISNEGDLLPSMGKLIRKGSKFGWVKPYSQEKEIYVAASELISYAGIIDAPSEGDEVIFTFSQNHQGPIAVCVHKQCSRDVMEELIEKTQRYDFKTCSRLKKQLEDLDGQSLGVADDANLIVYYLDKIGVSPNTAFSPDAVEKSFSEILTPEEYSKAIGLLIDEVVKKAPSKSYNLFLRSSSYTRTHKLYDVSKQLIERALDVFAGEEGKVKYFKGLLKTINTLSSRIEITEESMVKSLEISNRLFPLMPSYVRDAILLHKDFNGVNLDKETIRTGLYKEGYITEIKDAIKQNNADDLLYLTLMKLEFSFHPREYNPYTDAAKFLVNKAKNILALGDPDRYDEARYLLRLSYRNKSFEKGFDDTVGLYLMTLSGYTTMDIDTYMRGVQNDYKFEDLIKDAILNEVDNSVDLALLSSSNKSIKARIFKEYEKLGVNPNVIESMPTFLNEVKTLYNQFITNPTTGFQHFISSLKTKPVLIGQEVEIVGNDSSKLVSMVTDFNTGQKYADILTAYNGILRIINEIIGKLTSQPTEIGYETLLPVLKLLKSDIHDKFVQQENRLNPNIGLTILNPIEMIDKETANLKIEIRNSGNSARDIFLKSLVVSGMDLSESNEINVETKLSAGEEKIVNMELHFKDEVINEKVAEAFFAIEYDDIFISADVRKPEKWSGDRTITLVDEPFKEIDNKFSKGAGGTELEENDPMFYGRAKILNTIFDAIMSGKNNQIVIYGQKRSGKSSLLNQIKGKLEKQNSVICGKLSLQGIPDTESNSEQWILSNIAYSLLRGIRKYGIKDIKKSDAQMFFTMESNAFTALGDFIDKLSEHDSMNDVHFVILIDEFTKLYQLTKDGRVHKDFMPRWKALVERPGFNVQVVAAAQDTLPHFMKENYASNSFNIFDKEPLTYLSKEETLQLIKDPVQDVVFHNHSEELIYDYTAGSPFFTQIFCRKLIDYLNNVKKTHTVAKEEIEETAKLLCSGTDRLERGIFECLTQEADGSDYNDSDNEIVLKAIAEQTRAGGFVIIDDIKVGLSQEQLTKVLDNLWTRRVLSKEGEKYSINVKLFTQWILNN